MCRVFCLCPAVHGPNVQFLVLILTQISNLLVITPSFCPTLLLALHRIVLLRTGRYVLAQTRPNSAAVTDVNSQALMDYTDEVIDWIRARKSLCLSKTPSLDSRSSPVTSKYYFCLLNFIGNLDE